jgi:putative tryptophan/tyrosine transport system substrate-binding protein
MIGRRTFTAGLLAMAAAPLAAQAQQRVRRPLVAFISIDTVAGGAATVAAFRSAMQGYGWSEGREFDLVQRFSDGLIAPLPALVAELVALKPDVLLTGQITVVTAARAQIGTIPTVFANGADPVTLGVAESYRRPGGNVTGVASIPDNTIYAKRLQLIHEAVHKAPRIGLLVKPDAPTVVIGRPLIEAAAAALGITLVTVEFRTPDEFEATFATLVRERVAGLYGVSDSVMLAARERMAALELAARIPAIHHFADEARAGSLLGYGNDYADNFRRAAFLVHKVLTGSNPAELPIDVAPKVGLTVNLRTARALGLTLPESILLRADEIIE